MAWVRNPFSAELLRAAKNIRRGAYSTKAATYAFLAVGLSWLYGMIPLGVGLYLLSQGEILKAIVAPILIYLYVSLFLAMWPLFFLTGWYYEGFVPSLLGTGITVFVLLAPEWLMDRAIRAAEKAVAFDEEGESPR